MSQLLITLLQVPLSWENKEENLQYLAQKIEPLTSATDVIVLPELFTTGFSMQSQSLAETMQGKSVAWMRAIAAKKNCVVGGSLIVEEAGKYYNRFIWMQANGWNAAGTTSDTYFEWPAKTTITSVVKTK